jgi:hypothetical protein
VKVIELRKELRQPISPGHVCGDFLTAGMIVDMAVGVDDFHKLFLAFAEASSARNKRLVYL